MRKTRRAGLGGITLGIMLGLATQSTDAQNGLQWLYQSGDWGAWAAYAVPDTDHFIFSIGCVEGPEGVTLHVELPVFELGEGEPAWIELHRDDMTMRYDGRVFFNEMMSEHQVIGYAPRVAETFDTLTPFLTPPGSFTAAVPGGTETVPVDEAAAAALAVLRDACVPR